MLIFVSVMHAYCIVMFVLLCIDWKLVATIDCSDCEPCDCEEYFSGNNNQGKCHIINLLLFSMHVFVFSSLHV
jgi:hypothetical protein